MGETGKFYSWEIVNDITAIKNCDKSFFQHRGSGVPIEIRWFFDSENMQNGEQRPLILIYKNNEYKAHIEMESSQLSRTRMFWKADLKKEFDEVLKDYRLKSGKESGYPAIKFTKISSDTYKVEFIKIDSLNDENIIHLKQLKLKIEWKES